VSEIGRLSVEIKKKGANMENKWHKKLVRVIKKMIDDTIFIIFEDEDLQNPYYRIENGCTSL
jgi:hypothetical protein